MCDLNYVFMKMHNMESFKENNFNPPHPFQSTVFNPLQKIDFFHSYSYKLASFILNLTIVYIQEIQDRKNTMRIHLGFFCNLNKRERNTTRAHRLPWDYVQNSVTFELPVW